VSPTRRRRRKGNFSQYWPYGSAWEGFLFLIFSTRGSLKRFTCRTKPSGVGRDSAFSGSAMEVDSIKRLNSRESQGRGDAVHNEGNREKKGGLDHAGKDHFNLECPGICCSLDRFCYGALRRRRVFLKNEQER